MSIPGSIPSTNNGSSNRPLMGGGGSGFNNLNFAEASKPRRKKTSRACVHCQKAHVTCDEGRPCQRCMKKGTADTCHDGVRKQAKYLLDEPQEHKVTKTHQHNSRPIINPSASIQVPQFSEYLPPTPPDQITNRNNNSIANSTMSPLNTNSQQQFPGGADGQYDFGSKAANLEYSILSNMLRMETAQYAPDGTLLSSSLTPPESDTPNSTATTNNTNLLDFNSGLPPQQPPPPQQQKQQQPPPTAAMEFTATNEQPPSQQPLPQQQLQPVTTAEPLPMSNTNQPTESSDKHPEEVYESVKAPFPYTQGYHSLITYLRSRFGKRHLMHMAQAMAAYRPSFIATTKTLKEEDLIFMEKCFQRTLLEFEKFISFSGTPTVVWRRTGQIAAVGKEFCILTEWPRERLLNQSTFIVELMDDKSVTDYFDVFSKLAFGDSRGVTMTECTLLKPSGEKVPTACTWTVKRDVFDIPMMIIGNFLPILS